MPQAHGGPRVGGAGLRVREKVSPSRNFLPMGESSASLGELPMRGRARFGGLRDERPADWGWHEMWDEGGGHVGSCTCGRGVDHLLMVDDEGEVVAPERRRGLGREASRSWVRRSEYPSPEQHYAVELAWHRLDGAITRKLEQMQQRNEEKPL